MALRSMAAAGRKWMQHSTGRGRPQARALAGALALGAALLAGGPAWAQATDWQLTTEAELQDGSTPQRIDAFFDSRGQAMRLVGARGVALQFRRFQQPDRAKERGAIVVVSGRTESMLKYEEVVYDLFRNGFSVYIHDHRGQGLSDREPETAGQPELGHVHDFDDYVADLNLVLANHVLPQGHAKVYLLAHSMGGAITARFLESSLPAVARVQAAVLSSPMLGFRGFGGLSADLGLCQLAGTMRYFGQGQSQHLGGSGWAPADPKNNPYSKSEVRSQRMVAMQQAVPKIRLGSPSWGWLAESCNATQDARHQAGQVRTPVRVQVAADESIVFNPGAVQFCAGLPAALGGCGGPDGGPVVVPDAKHELFIERDAARGLALRGALDFLVAR